MSETHYTILEKKKIYELDLIRPDICPFCHHGINPEIFFGYEFEKDLIWHIRVVYSCPRKECLEVFFGIYSKSNIDIYDRGSPQFRGCSPFKFKEEQFEQAVQEISPNFVLIYNQAKQAEERNLDQICGLGYRKALEFLIKDYLTSKYPSDEEKIKNNHRFDSVIEQYVTDDKVKFFARRASWLGNDHAHYTRKWEDKDTSDLKRLIKTSLYWISAEKELEYYEKEMQDGRK
jgi:hypothetical protein